MTPIERTAYPHFNKKFSPPELEVFFMLTDVELQQLINYSRSKKLLLVLAITLKTRQYLGYFIGLNQIPQGVVSVVGSQLSIEFDDKRPLNYS